MEKLSRFTLVTVLISFVLLGALVSCPEPGGDVNGDDKAGEKAAAALINNKAVTVVQADESKQLETILAAIKTLSDNALVKGLAVSDIVLEDSKVTVSFAEEVEAEVEVNLFDTITAAIADDDAVILVGVGEYDEAITINRGLALVSLGGAEIKQVVKIDASDVSVVGFKITSDTQGISFIHDNISYENITIKDNVIDSQKHGIARLQNSKTFDEDRDVLKNLSIINNEIKGGADDDANQGIFLFTALRGATVISNNKITKEAGGLNAGINEDNFYAEGDITITDNIAPEGAVDHYFAIWVNNTEATNVVKTGNTVTVGVKQD